MEFGTLTEKEFTEFESKHKLGSFYQTIKWGKLKEYNGWSYYTVGIKNNKKVIAASLILKKKVFGNVSIMYAPRGFLLDYNNNDVLSFFVSNVKKFAKSHHAIFIKIDPTVNLVERDINGDLVKDGINNSDVVENLLKLKFMPLEKGNGLQPKLIFTLDISKDLDTLFENFEPTTKKMIKKNEKIGIYTRELKIDELPKFKDIMIKTSERRGFIDRPLSYYEKMYKTFGDEIKFLISEVDLKEYKKNVEKEKEDTIKLKEKLTLDLDKENISIKKTKNKINETEILIRSLNKKIEVADELIEKNGEVLELGAIVYLLHNKEVLTLFGGAYGEYRDFMSAYTLNWNIIKKEKENGYEKYNFYGISEFKNKDDEMYGLYDFKRGFGGVVEEYIGEFTLVISKFWYFVYNVLYSKIYVKLKNFKLKKK